MGGLLECKRLNSTDKEALTIAQDFLSGSDWEVRIGD
jgi:hypothetical protein